MNRWIAWPVAFAFGLILIASVISEVWWMPLGIKSVNSSFPETEWMYAPALIWGILVASCWQAVIVLAMTAMVRNRPERSSFTGAYVAWTGGLLVAVLILTIVAAIFLTRLGFMSPAALISLVAMGLIAVASAVSITYAYFAGPGTGPRRT